MGSFWGISKRHDRSRFWCALLTTGYRLIGERVNILLLFCSGCCSVSPNPKHLPPSCWEFACWCLHNWDPPRKLAEESYLPKALRVYKGWAPAWDKSEGLSQVQSALWDLLIPLSWLTAQSPLPSSASFTSSLVSSPRALPSKPPMANVHLRDFCRDLNVHHSSSIQRVGGLPLFSWVAFMS